MLPSCDNYSRYSILTGYSSVKCGGKPPLKFIGHQFLCSLMHMEH